MIPRPARSFLTHPLFALFLLSLLATLIYSNTFSSSFQFDDLRNIVDNPKIRGPIHMLELSSSRYVGLLTFAMNHHFDGLGLFGFHLVNLLIHITNGFLVYSLVLLLFRAAGCPQNGHWPAVASALLFVAHPIQTEAVTYIVQRFTSLAALFYLLGVVGYLRWKLENRFLWYGVALVSTVLGMKTKEFVFTLPLMILLVEILFFKGKRWGFLIPFLPSFLIIPFSRFDVMREANSFLSETTLISRSDYLFTQFRVIMTYLRLLLLPIRQNLVYDYPVYHTLFAPPVFASFLFLSTLFASAVFFLRRSARQLSPLDPSLRLIAFGIFWFFLTLSAESSIIPIRDVIFEHRVYLPSVGFFLSACIAGSLLISRRRLMGFLSMSAIVLILSVATYQRNRVWQNAETLWADVIQKSPHKAKPHNNLGNAYLDSNRLEEAIREYQTALSLQPDYALAHNNLGNAYSDQGQLEKAIQEYQEALRLQPDLARAHYNLGVAYNNQGHLDLAIREYQTALRLQPGNAEVHNNLGMAYGDQGRLEEAIGEYQEAIRLQPDLAEVHYNLGLIYKSQGQPELAIREYQATIKFQSRNAMAHRILGLTYSDQGDYEEAIREYQEALKIQPDNAQTHNNLGIAYSNQGRTREAIGEYQEALRLQPNHAEARNNLGIAYTVQGKFEEAIREYQEALRLQPDYAGTHFNLATAYKMLGRLREAAGEYRIVLKLQPDFPHARQALDDLKALPRH